MRAANLDRLQENKLERLEDLVGSWTFTSSGDEQGAIADFIVDEGIGLRLGLLRLWELYWRRALAGAIADRPAEKPKLRRLLERGNVVLARGAELARAYAKLSGLEVARLHQFEEQVQTFSGWILECMALWDMLDQPRQPLNHELVARSRAEFARGEYEELESIIARVQQGGPIAKE